MTDTTTKTAIPDTTTLVPPAAAKGVKAPKAKAAKAPPAPKPAAPVKAKAPIVRVVAAGAKIDPEAVVTVLVDNPKAPGSKAHGRFARYATGHTVKYNLAVSGGPVIADLRYDFERRFVDVTPAPAHTVK